MSGRDIIKKDSANFTPTLGNYTDLQPFRFWCQKVLPLVYDDSLSYYELLCKVVDYLNKTMEDVGVLEGDVTGLHEAYKKLQGYVNDYFSTLDVQEEINNKLDAMAKDGSLTELIKKYVDPFIDAQNKKIGVLEERMNTFTQLPNGSTSADAELIDIRVPASGFNDGKAYSTAGDAVRGQVETLNKNISDTQKYLCTGNLDVVNTMLSNGYLTNKYTGGTWKYTAGKGISIKKGLYYVQVFSYKNSNSGYFSLNNTAITGNKVLSFNGDAAKILKLDVDTTLFPVLQVSTDEEVEIGNYYTRYSIYSLADATFPKELTGVNTLEKILYNANTTIENKLTEMSANDKLSVIVPNIKQEYVISFYGEINNLVQLQITQGTNLPYMSSIVNIDKTTLTVYNYTNVLNKVFSANHNIKISDYIGITIYVKYNHNAHIIITSISRTYECDVTWDGCYSIINAVLINGEMNNCALTYFAKDIKKDVWGYGDSYFDMWIETANNYGFSGWLVDGYSGRNSVEALISLKRGLELGHPKIILWCLGMNDPDTADSVNNNWYSTFEELKTICESNNIKLILSTIPNTPKRNNRFKNAIIKSSGLRFVDICECVGADISDNWFNGLLSPDNVHPSQLGRRVIASRFISDVPELIS